MVDFGAMNRHDREDLPINPGAVFRRLPKPPHINDLWDSQTSVLREWFERRHDNDLVIKLNTGGGKTLVGLLIAQSLLNELEEPALYLCANTQLVNQTREKAGEVGIPATSYPTGPAPLPRDFRNGEAILIGTYHALFNGRSKFGVLGRGEPVSVGTIICDDAHTAFSTLRDIYSLDVERNRHGDLYAELVTRFRGAFQDIRRGGSFDDIVERGEFGVLEVPYWAWEEQMNEIRELLSRQYGEEFGWVLPLITDAFDYCHALISRSAFTITPFHPLVRQIPTFDECEHRVYMSATIPDDSSIVTTFDADPATVGDPIAPDSLAGVGERMILAPSLSGISEQETMEMAQGLCREIAQDSGVVVLVPSREGGSVWSGIGRQVEGDDVTRAVEALNGEDTTGPFIFPNRYDGIDLLGDACRLLIMDGLPQGTTRYDRFRADVLRGESSLNVNLARRVEQGLGRGTRGAGDYCVVLILGSDLVSWLSRRNSLDLMTPSTAAQIQIGHEISDMTKDRKSLREAINQCLTRDTDWTHFHAERLAQETAQVEVDQAPLAAAAAEREHLSRIERYDYEGAVNVVREFLAAQDLDRRLEGWLSQLAARTANQWVSEPLAHELQESAFGANPLLLPPMAEPTYHRVQHVGAQARNLVSKVTEYQMRKGLLAEFEDMVAWLTPAATSNQFEEAMKQLGNFLGLVSQRPEREVGMGPDVLWLAEESVGFVIEVKSNKNPQNALRRHEHGQLLDSERWFQGEYPDWESLRIVVHPNAVATPETAAGQSLALTFEALGRLIGRLRGVLREICTFQGSREELEERTQRLLREEGLVPGDFRDAFFEEFLNEDQ